MTREHDLERPILARVGVRGLFREPVPMRWPPLSVRSFRCARRAIALPLPRKGRQRATPHPRRRLPVGTSPPGRWSIDGHRSSTRRVRSDAPSPSSVAPRMVEAMTMCVMWADSPGAKVPRTLWRQAAESAGRFPSSVAGRAPRVSPCGMGSEGWRTFRMTTRPRSPSRFPPRRGEPSRQSGCFLPPENPARGRPVCAGHVDRPSVDLSSRRSSRGGGSLAIEKVRASLAASYFDACP